MYGLAFGATVGWKQIEAEEQLALVSAPGSTNWPIV